MNSLGNLRGRIVLYLGLWTALGAVAGPLDRVPNTTLRMPSAPPVLGYTVTNAFGNLTFTDPVGIRTPPGETNRLFVVEQGGRIAVITNLAAPNRTVFLDISGRILGGVPTDERGLLSMAFHPGYATNGYFFVFYTGNATTTAGGGMHDIVARFRVSAGNPNQADPNSELRLILQLDNANNHNAGDLHFGPDGYLYVALGDEGGGNDQYNNSQLIDRDFFSAIARIDVDKRPGNLAPNPHPAATSNYSVPADNPFVGATSFNGLTVSPGNVRTEFWAVGLRNPWRFHFDDATGHLYCADVGQNVWEEIDIITRGGNYGWAYREGLHPGAKTAPPGFVSINPILEYAHGSGTNQGFSVTGGVVYRGARLSQLTGAYVFADYVSGNIWSLRYDGSTASGWQRLAGDTGIAGFGIDPRNGDVLMANQNRDTLRRLVYSATSSGAPIPPTLADTGAFANPATLVPNPGIVPYDVNVPFWSDNAHKQRWFSVPNVNLTIGFSPENNWSFPTGTVWIKHFELELTNGVAASRKRLETRFLVKNSGGVYGVTYRWGSSTSNAQLVAEEGLDESFVVDDGGGVVRTQVWHYPSRQECNLCHTPQAGFALAFGTHQLNRDYSYSGGTTNQLAALSEAPYFDKPVANHHTLPALAAMNDESVSLEYRVRSYLAANCVSCHQPGGVPQSLWDARITTPTAGAGLVNGPVVDDGGNPDLRVFKPGSLENSAILQRIATAGPKRMPPIASTVLDVNAAKLLSAWITNDLPSYQTYEEWQVARFGSTNAPASQPGDDFDGDNGVNRLEHLLGTDPKDPASVWKIGIRQAAPGIEIVFPQAANRAFQVEALSSLAAPWVWQPLNVPENRPFYSITNRTAAVPDLFPGQTQFYRVRVTAP